MCKVWIRDAARRAAGCLTEFDNLVFETVILPRINQLRHSFERVFLIPEPVEKSSVLESLSASSVLVDAFHVNLITSFHFLVPSSLNLVTILYIAPVNMAISEFYQKKLTIFCIICALLACKVALRAAMLCGCKVVMRILAALPKHNINVAIFLLDFWWLLCYNRSIKGKEGNHYEKASHLDQLQFGL